MWGERNTALCFGYPNQSKDHPAARVNIERALAAFQDESRAKQETSTESKTDDVEAREVGERKRKRQRRGSESREGECRNEFEGE